MNGWGLFQAGLHAQTQLARSQAETMQHWLSHFRPGSLPGIWGASLAHGLQHQLQWQATLARMHQEWMAAHPWRPVGLMPTRWLHDLIGSAVMPTRTVAELLDTTATAWSLSRSKAG
jgi:hypothetical protein